MPALPLDGAGRYVAGVYVAFVILVVVYVVIIAAKVSGMEEELEARKKPAEDWRR